MRFPGPSLLCIRIAVVAAGSNGFLGCHPTPTDPPVPLEASVGKSVTLVGIAEARKGGVAVRGPDFYVWLEGISQWPDGVATRKIKVTGELREDHNLPVFVANADDSGVPQGVPLPPGTDLVEASRRLIVRHAAWTLIK
jgi:hypothetical protein